MNIYSRRVKNGFYINGFTSGYIRLAAGFIIISQRKELQHLREVNGKLQVEAGRDEWIKKTREVIKKDGKVEAVKYIRDETGMSLAEATQFVDKAGTKK